MEIIDISSIKPAGAEVANFQGFEHGASVSFFVVEFSPGKGPVNTVTPMKRHLSFSRERSRLSWTTRPRWLAAIRS